MQIIDLRKAQKALQPLIEAAEGLAKQDLPATRYALAQASAYVMQTWVGYASGGTIPTTGKTIHKLIKSEDDQRLYRNGIVRRPLGKFSWIIENVAGPISDRVVEGTPRRDLKEEVKTWPRRKIAKAGHAYAHIPFRHKVAHIKAAAPKVHRKVTKMVKSTVVGFRRDARGVRRALYSWGQRLKSDPNVKVSRRMAGMVRMETSTGRGKSSTYLTFRTVSSQNSPAGSWVIKQVMGVDMAKIVAQQTERKVQQLVGQGVDTDLGLLT